MKLITIQVTDEEHRQIKSRAAFHGITIKKFLITSAILDEMENFQPEKIEDLFSTSGAGLTNPSGITDSVNDSVSSSQTIHIQGGTKKPPTPQFKECKNGHPLDWRGKCLQKGCKYS